MLQAKKSLGQHFLNSKSALEEIIRASNIIPGEKVLEIGPGTGILTHALLCAGAKVVAVEKDARAIELEALKHPNLSLIHADILESDIGKIIQNEPYKLVANIPYYITGAILEKFLENDPRPTEMVLLVQKEVADRIVARDEKESILSISVKAFGLPSIVAKVPKGAFNPPPKVDSAILKIAEISDKKFIEKGLDIRFFFSILKAGFAHKRKFLIRNLETAADAKKITAAFEILQMNPKSRAEDLKLEDWFNLASKLRD